MAHLFFAELLQLNREAGDGPKAAEVASPIPSIHPKCLVIANLAYDWNRITRPLSSITPGLGNTCSWPSCSPLFETVTGISVDS